MIGSELHGTLQIYEYPSISITSAHVISHLDLRFLCLEVKIHRLPDNFYLVRRAKVPASHF